MYDVVLVSDKLIQQSFEFIAGCCFTYQLIYGAGSGYNDLYKQAVCKG